MGEVATNPGDYSLVTSGVGSCLVISLYDPKLRIGTLAHAMLPSRVSPAWEDSHGGPTPLSSLPPALSGRHGVADGSVSTEAAEAKFVDAAIDHMLSSLQGKGAKRADLEAKLIGGANMFPSLIADDIGKKNILRARDRLRAEGIKIVGECVGGSQGRSVEFSPTTGIVTVKIIL